MITRKQSSTGSNSIFASTVTTAAFGSPLTPGSYILVAWEADLSTTVANTPTDTAGNTYTRLAFFADATNTGTRSEVWAAVNAFSTASNQVTITDNGAGVNSVAIAEEWTGLGLSSPFDKTASTSGNSGTADSGATTQLSQLNELVWVACVENTNPTNFTLFSGFTNLTTASCTTPSGLGVASKVVNSTAAVNGKMTLTSGTWSAIVVTIKAISPSFKITKLKPAPFKPGNAR